MQHVFTFKNLEPANVWNFCFQNYLNDYPMNKIVFAFDSSPKPKHQYILL